MIKNLKYLLERRALKNGKAKPKPAKPKKPLNKRSIKLKKSISTLIKLYKLFLAKHQVCEISGPTCTHKATTPHHSEGRVGKNLMDTTKWIPSCAPCNLWCETNSKEAKMKGVSKSRLKK